MGSLLSYGLLCGLACLVALAAGRKAFFSALAVLAGWGFYNTIWFEGGPAHMVWGALRSMGIGYTDIWAATDLMIASVVLYHARTQWWGLAIWAILLVQMGLHTAHQYAGLAFAPYSIVLDALFLGQLSVFFMLGGGRCVAIGPVILDHARHVLRSPQTVSGETG